MPTEVDWSKYGHVIASSYRKRMLLALAEGPKTPKQVAEVTKVYPSHVSTFLKELQNEGLVRCLSPTLKRGKIYALTDEGKVIVDQIRRLAEDGIGDKP